jgi:hypothetical protein
MEFLANTRLPLHSTDIIYPSPSLRTTLHFGIIFTHIHLYYLGESKRALKTPFLAINAKGERVLAQSKRTAPPCQFQNFRNKFKLLNVFSIGIFESSIPLRNSISIGIYILRRSLSKIWYLKYLIFFQLVNPS